MQELRLDVFENRVVWRIFGRLRKEAGENRSVRKFINPTLPQICFTSDRIKVDEIFGHVASIIKLNAYIILIGKRGGKRALVRPRRRWENGITVVL
jgi:hypothetical protein